MAVGTLEVLTRAETAPGKVAPESDTAVFILQKRVESPACATWPPWHAGGRNDKLLRML